MSMAVSRSERNQSMQNEAKSRRIDPTSRRADEGTWARWFVRSEQRRAAFNKSQRRRELVEDFFG